MHMVMLSIPTNVVKQDTNMTINPKLDDVLATLEVVEQQMRQLNNTNFPLPPDRRRMRRRTMMRTWRRRVLTWWLSDTTRSQLGRPRSAMKQAWSRLEREERERSRPARQQLRVRFSLPSTSLPASQLVGSEEQEKTLCNKGTGRYTVPVQVWRVIAEKMKWTMTSFILASIVMQSLSSWGSGC